MKIQLDMYQTLAVAVLVLLLGNFLKKRINFLEKFCIPSPVIGGLLFAIVFVTQQELLNFPLMTLYEKFAWYSFLHL